MSAEQNRAALARAITAFNDGDLDTYLEVYDPSVRVHGYTPVAMDLATVRAFYTGIFAAFPDSQVTIDETVAEGDMLAARFTQRATHTGDFMGVPATAKEIVLAGHTTMRFALGRIVERWSTADMLGLLIQLGAVPPPG